MQGKRNYPIKAGWLRYCRRLLADSDVPPAIYCTYNEFWLTSGPVAGSLNFENHTVWRSFAYLQNCISIFTSVSYFNCWRCNFGIFQHSMRGKTWRHLVLSTHCCPVAHMGDNYCPFSSGPIDNRFLRVAARWRNRTLPTP